MLLTSSSHLACERPVTNGFRSYSGKLPAASIEPSLTSITMMTPALSPKISSMYFCISRSIVSDISELCG